MAWDIEEWWVVISQRLIVKRLEFMFRVVGEEGNFLSMISFCLVVEMLYAYSRLFYPGIRSSELLYRLNRKLLHGSCLQKTSLLQEMQVALMEDANQRALYARDTMPQRASRARSTTMQMFSTIFLKIDYIDT